MTPSVTSAQLAAAVKSATQAGTDPSMQQAGERFKALMQNPRMEAPADRAGDTGMVGKLAAAQDAELQQAVSDVTTFSDQTSNMSIGELTSGAIKVSLELAQTQLDMEAKMGVVNSSKSSVETLMKNQ
ncbi:type III secretion protein HrpB2 [Paraburkholderia sediminicola]|uniref:type III secretion protein HrpB2 n=1 Tax=Paraburkholderia sediminicola TaxID=458836 RepID=UPI0038BD7CBC